jgi:hypothetical protein
MPTSKPSDEAALFVRPHRARKSGLPWLLSPPRRPKHPNLLLLGGMRHLRSAPADRLNAVLLLPESAQTDVPRSRRNESRFNAAMMGGKRRTGRIDGRLNVAVRLPVKAGREKEGPMRSEIDHSLLVMNGVETGRTAGRTSAANHLGKRETRKHTTGVDVLRGRLMAATKNHTITTDAMIVRGSRINVRIVPKVGGRSAGRRRENRMRIGADQSMEADVRRGHGTTNAEIVLVVEVGLQRAGETGRTVRSVPADLLAAARRSAVKHRGLPLARRTEMSASACYDDFSDGCAANNTGEVFSCVHPVPLLKRTTTSLRIHVIGHGGSAVFNCFS